MIFVTGDMHGVLSRFDDPRLRKLKTGDTLIVCGDFGFLWDESKKETNTLKKLSKKKYNICFVDGTHENFDMLEKIQVTTWKGGKVHRISDNIFHLMRGQIYIIGGKRIFTMGGGESPDIKYRFETKAWSDKEFPLREELLEGVDNLQRFQGETDIIITHEPPAKIKEFLLMQTDKEAGITAINTYLEDLSKTCEFSHWYFGSLHMNKIISKKYICLYDAVVNAATGVPVRAR